jgi:hypothetical protein
MPEIQSRSVIIKPDRLTSAESKPRMRNIDGLIVSEVDFISPVM